MDPLVVLNAIRDNPYLLNLVGVPLAVAFIYGIYRGIQDKKSAPAPVASAPDWMQGGGVHFQGPFERMISLLDHIFSVLRDIRDHQERAARVLAQTQEDQLRQTTQHSVHMDDIKGLIRASMRYERRHDREG